jgi:hypothetical protein
MAFVIQGVDKKRLQGKNNILTETSKQDTPVESAPRPY